MTRDDASFTGVFIVSLVLHVLLTALFLLLPPLSISEHQSVSVYTVRITEAPPRPQARDLEFSTEAISEVDPSAPSLFSEAPQASEAPPAAEAPQPPAAEAEAPPAEAPPPPAETGEAPPATETPPPAESPAEQPPAPQPGVVAEQTSPRPLTTQPGPVPAPEPEPQPETPQDLPQLPQVGSPEQAPPRPPAEEPGETPAAAAPSLPEETGEAPPRQTREQAAMEELRQRLENLDLSVSQEEAEAEEEESAVQPPPSGGQAGSTPERSLFALRLFQNRAAEAVKENYTFPSGGFAPGLRARAEVVLNRDGSQEAVRLLESSGDERFDRLVCLAAINQAEFPPIPDAIEQETLTLTFTCAP